MARIKRIMPIILALAILAGSLGGCGSEKTAESPEQSPEASDGAMPKEKASYPSDGKFTLNCSLSSSFNPMTTTDLSNILVTQLMYDNLLEVDAAFNYTPGVVTECKSDDGSGWYFQVDTNAKFWDGTLVTAYDAAYSVQCAMRSPRFSDRLDCVIGAEAENDDTFVININGKNTLFPVLLNIPLIKNGSVGETIPMGSGPYVLNGEMSELAVNTHHKNAASLPVDKIYLTEITDIEDKISAFEDAKIDLVTNDPMSFTNLGYGSANEKRAYATTNMHYIGFNLSGQYFSNTLFRKAMTYIIDREYIVTNIMNGMASAATLPFHPAGEYYNENFSEIISCSVSKAEEALDKAEVKDYDNDGLREIMVTGIPIETGIDFIVCSDNVYKIQAARSIVKSMEALGINVTLRELPWEAYKTALTAGNYDMYYAETKLSADFNLKAMLFMGGPLNYGGISDSTLEGHISAYMSASDEERQKVANLMFKYLTDTAPIVTICFEKQQVVTHSGVITGLRPTQYNIFHGIEEWKIDLG